MFDNDGNKGQHKARKQSEDDQNDNDDGKWSRKLQFHEPAHDRVEPQCDEQCESHIGDDGRQRCDSVSDEKSREHPEPTEQAEPESAVDRHARIYFGVVFGVDFVVVVFGTAFFGASDFAMDATDVFRSPI